MEKGPRNQAIPTRVFWGKWTGLDHGVQGGRARALDIWGSEIFVYARRANKAGLQRRMGCVWMARMPEHAHPNTAAPWTPACLLPSLLMSLLHPECVTAIASTLLPSTTWWSVAVVASGDSLPPPGRHGPRENVWRRRGDVKQIWHLWTKVPQSLMTWRLGASTVVLARAAARQYICQAPTLYCL